MFSGLENFTLDENSKAVMHMNGVYKTSALQFRTVVYLWQGFAY